MFLPDPDPDFSPIPDPGVKKAPDPGSAKLLMGPKKEMKDPPPLHFCLETPTARVPYLEIKKNRLEEGDEETLEIFLCPNYLEIKNRWWLGRGEETLHLGQKPRVGHLQI